MPFEFVDNNAAIDHAARKRIRAHVALGKNAGKKLSRPSRKKAFGVKTSTTLIHIPKGVETTHAHDSESAEEVLPEIEQQIGDGLSILSFPVRLTPGYKRLVQKGMCGSFQAVVQTPSTARHR